jgi:hypothetical protein
MNVIRFITFYVLIYVSSFYVNAQIGGRNAFSSMYVPNNAFTASLGGMNITSGQDSVFHFTQNPALLNEKSSQKAGISYNRWQADIGQFSLAYLPEIKKLKTGQIGIHFQHINYGTMELTDPTGVASGTFSASDFGIGVAYSQKQGHFRFGGQLKFLGSQIETYRAYALVSDIGGIFIHPEHDFTIGLTLKNVGFRLRDYLPNTKSTLPFDAQLGTSFKPKYMPIRFAMVFHHLHNWQITYYDPALNTQLDLNGQPIIQEKTFFEEFSRHFVLGAEILLHQNFQINVGYNHLINREMRIRGLGGARGLTFGFQFKVKAFRLGYAYNGFQAGGGGRNFFTLCINTNHWKKKINIE